MGANIRRMATADLPQVAEIEAAVFPRPWSIRDFFSELTVNPVARYLVAELDGQILGFAGVHIILDEGHITNVAVLPAARGRGLGKSLMAELMQYAANLGVRYLTLEVRQSNEVAIAMYRGLGFFKVSVRKKYYEDNGEDAWLMVTDRLPNPQAGFTEPETVTE